MLKVINFFQNSIDNTGFGQPKFYYANGLHFLGELTLYVHPKYAT